jgi:hypothetical protein
LYALDTFGQNAVSALTPKALEDQVSKEEASKKKKFLGKLAKNFKGVVLLLFWTGTCSRSVTLITGIHDVVRVEVSNNEMDPTACLSCMSIF